MKRSLKPLAVFALILLCAAFPARTSAADEDIVPTRVMIYHEDRNVSFGNRRITVSRGREILLDYRVYPEDANVSLDVTWRSSNTRVAEVDNSGYVYALEPGESTITVRTANGRSDSCVI